jgi:hypothetical protein
MSPLLDTLVSEPSEKIDGADSGAVDFAALKSKIFGKGNKSPRRKSPEKEIAEEKTTENDLAEIFAGENWEEVASLYFDARFAITGYQEFQLTNGQKKTLGLSLGKTMKMLLKIDPGYIALIVFTANFGGLIAQKEMMYKQAQKEMEKGKGRAVS